ncbi:intraflagellar transport protein 43 homolog A-like isoform X2 [Lineus longissimus]|uniref:intraflagellar transport protein 43 homolog A-like isoform X2 n=1 Tax=Lineus longissimus TaxID=88925 RepID=UPI002B4EB5EB
MDDDLEYNSKARSAKRGRRAQAQSDPAVIEEEKTFDLGKAEEPDDLELETDVAATTRTGASAKKGRRARGQPAAGESHEGNGEHLATGNDVRPPRSGDMPPKPSKRGGWGEESNATASAPRSARRRVGEEMEELAMGDIEKHESQSPPGGEISERLRPRTPQKSDDEGSDNEIPVIPDLEEYQEEDLSQQIAQAPNIAVNRVATFRELDNDLLRHAAFLTLDNEIDLKLLAKWLSAESEVIEEDRQWDWDRLFTEVASELTTEWEKDESSEESKEKDIIKV